MKGNEMQISMTTYPLTELAALVITPELAAVINSCDWHPEDDMPDPSSLTNIELIAEYGDVSEAYNKLYVYFGQDVYFCPMFEGKGVHLLPEVGGSQLEDIRFDDDDLCYIPPEKDASLFKAAYRDVDELIQEFRDKLTKQKIDLRGFPLETCVCSLSGTYYC